MITFRKGLRKDIREMAVLRSAEWGSEDYWIKRIEDYLTLKSHPNKAKTFRIIYVALENYKIIGFVAGHLSSRFDCDGELQWLNVNNNFQRKGIGSILFETGQIGL